MRYTLKIPAPCGEVIPLIRIAECMAMANPVATITGDIPYHAPSFESVYRDYGEDLLGTVSAGRLKICNERGFHLSVESYIDDVTEPWIERMGRLFVTLYSLNEWAAKKGHTFTISNEGAEYVIGRSDENGKMEVAVYGTHAAAPTLPPAESPISTPQAAPASGSLNHDAPLNMKALNGVRMKILSHKHLHGRDFGSSLLGVTEFSEWLSNKRLRIETSPNICEYDFVQVEALLCAVERAAFGSVTDDEAKEIVAADQIMVADNMASDAPLWLVGAEAHRKWREVITRAVMSGSLQLLDFGSKLPASIPTAAKIEGEARGWVDAKTDITAAPTSEPMTPAALLPEQARDAGLSKREKQIRAIELAIATLGLSAMSIPTGEKNNVQAECKRVSTLFGGGIDPFKEAWQEALNQKRVRTVRHSQYSGG